MSKHLPMDVEEHLDALMEIVIDTEPSKFSSKLMAYRQRSELHDDFLDDLANLLNASSAAWDESMRGTSH